MKCIKSKLNRFVTHVTALLAVTGTLAAQAASDTDSLLLQGESLRQKGRYTQAQQIINRAIATLESMPSGQPAQLSAAYNYLSLVENNAGKYVDAEKHARMAIDFAKQAKLDERTVVMHSVVLANALRQQGLFTDAEKILLGALPVLDHADTDQSLLGTAQNNLGAIYFWLGKYDKAMPILLEGLQTRIKALGPDHLDVANSYLDLGATELKIGNTDKARDYLSRSVSIRKKQLGSAHPETLAAEATLAVILEAQGENAEASKLLEQVVARARRTLGRTHPDLAQYEDDYANVLASQKLFAQARKIQAEALSIREQVYGPNSRDVAASLRSLAQIESAAGSTDKAGELLQKSAALYKAAGQQVDPDYADTLDDLGMYLAECGKTGAAIAAFTDAAAIRAQSGPTVSGAVSHANLADVLSREGRNEESLAALKKAAGIIDALPEPLKKSADCAAIRERLEAQSRASR